MKWHVVHGTNAKFSGPASSGVTLGRPIPHPAFVAALSAPIPTGAATSGAYADWSSPPARAQLGPAPALHGSATAMLPSAS